METEERVWTIIKENGRVDIGLSGPDTKARYGTINEFL